MSVMFVVEKAFVINQCCGSTNSVNKEARFFAHGELLLHNTVAQKQGLKNNTKSSSLTA